MTIVEVRGGRLTPQHVYNRYTKWDLVYEYLRVLDELDRERAVLTDTTHMGESGRHCPDCGRDLD